MFAQGMWCPQEGVSFMKVLRLYIQKMIRMEPEDGSERSEG